MSYSFSIKADSKDEAAKLVEAELAKVVEQQPVHAADYQAAQEVAEGFIAILADPGESEQISVSVYGSLSWRTEGVLTGANVNVSASIVQRTA